MFNQGGFNSLSYNQLSIDFEVNKEDSLNTTATEQTSSEAELSSSDELVISIAEFAQIEPVVQLDTLVLTTDESIDIYRETSGLDPPIVTITETANIDNEITTSDELLVTDKIYLPLGFNQQGFNQPQGRYFEESEESTRDKFISVSDDLNATISSTLVRDAELFLLEDLDVSIDDYNGLSKPEDVNDDITLTLLEEASVEVLHTSEDSLLVTEKEYLPLGFNQQGFNQTQRRYYLETEESTLESYIEPLDSLLITIDRGTNYNADVFGDDSIAVSLLESKILDKPQETSDNLEVTFTETADLEVITDSQDTLLVTYEFVAPLGFNQIGFNQAQETYIESGEDSKVGQSIVDSLELNTSSSSVLNTEITPLDILEVRSLQNKQGVSVTLSAQDTLETVLAEARALNKPEYVQDNIDFDIYEDSDLVANFAVVDELDVNIGNDSYVTSTLMFKYLGKYRKIKKGYVLVNGQWKTIVRYRGVVGNEWKNLKE